MCLSVSRLRNQFVSNIVIKSDVLFNWTNSKRGQIITVKLTLTVIKLHFQKWTKYSSFLRLFLLTWFNSLWIWLPRRQTMPILGTKSNYVYVRNILIRLATPLLIKPYFVCLFSFCVKTKKNTVYRIGLIFIICWVECYYSMFLSLLWWICIFISVIAFLITYNVDGNR